MEAIKQFLKSKGRTEATAKSYSSVIAKFKNKLGDKFTEEQLEEQFTILNLKPRTYNNYRTIMNFFCKEFLDYKLTFTKAKVPDSLPTFVSFNEIIDVMRTIPNLKHKLIISLMYGSGLRVSEVCKIKRYNVYPDELKLFVEEGKGMKDRWTIIKPRTALVLKRFMIEVEKQDRENPHLFQTYRGHISERSIQERLKKAINDSQIQKYFTCHDLRHSFAINFLNKTNDLDTLKDLLGHKDIRTTQIYTRCRTTDLTALALEVG